MVQSKPEHLYDDILQIGHKISNKINNKEYINVELIKLIQGMFANAKEKLLAMLEAVSPLHNSSHILRFSGKKPQNKTENKTCFAKHKFRQILQFGQNMTIML